MYYELDCLPPFTHLGLYLNWMMTERKTECLFLVTILDITHAVFLAVPDFCRMQHPKWWPIHMYVIQ